MRIKILLKKNCRQGKKSCLQNGVNVKYTVKICRQFKIKKHDKSHVFTIAEFLKTKNVNY